ncbi:polysaccharide pyruvyl transferase family protein [Pseudomonas abieticivorans]|uniref:polysaccharide pyruvyl transferase family protein n=1 Tax=Pseudomonas abieticivorans TaxID=2931382 RepID=UPI0020BEE6BA|nr:polysaccharide pyruvyl transferase family protein [Pseudomonas sp. PIA16]
MNIVIGGVPFSQNLGDGIIFDNIKNLYDGTQKATNISPLDIAGRDDFETGATSSDLKFRVLSAIPSMGRKPLLALFFYLKYLGVWRKSWRSKLAEADLLTLGGGQLFLDEELNFPLKLYFLSLTAKQLPALKTVIAFVGVSPTLSPVGRLLFRRALKNFNPQSISVRDEASRQNFIRLINPHLAVKVVPDPGVNSKQCYRVESLPGDQHRRIGICISNPKGLDVQGRLGRAFHAQTRDYFESLVKLLNQQGYHVSLFTNGASEDELLKDEIHEACAAWVAVCEQKPRTPSDLVNTINRYDLIVAHRLHANIIAYSLGITSIGLRWDTKLESFFKSINREHLFIDTVLPTAVQTVALIDEHLDSRLSSRGPRLIHQLMDEVESHLA